MNGSVEASAQDSYRFYGCDRVHFDTREKVCKAWGQRCFKGGKLNHFANFCKARTRATCTWRVNNLLAESHPEAMTPPEAQNHPQPRKQVRSCQCTLSDLH